MKCVVQISGDGYNSCNVVLTEQEFIGVQKVFDALNLQAKNTNDNYIPTGSITIDNRILVGSTSTSIVNQTPKVSKDVKKEKTMMQIAMEKAGISI